LDASISHNYKNTPKILNAGNGFSWRFDDNYEDVLLRFPKKDDKKKDKSKKNKSIKGKDKEKAKKRLDEFQVEKPQN